MSLLVLWCLGFAATAEAQPAFAKVFSPDTIGRGSTTTLTFTIDNTAGPVTTDLAFTDNLPAGMTIADPAQAISTCEGLITAPVGGGVITFADGRVSAASTCTVKVDVTSGAVGPHTNTSGALTSSAGNSGTATDDLAVDIERPGFTKSFAPDSVPLGGRSRLIFTIDNSLNEGNSLQPKFEDNLPTGMVVADPANTYTDCPSGAVTAVPGSSLITFTGASVAAISTCTVSVDVFGNAVGMLGNTSGGLFLFGDATCGKAADTLTVTVDPLSLVKGFPDDPVPPGGQTPLTFTIANRNRTESASNIAFTDDLNTVLPGLEAVGLPLIAPCGAGSQLTGTSLLTFTGGNLGPEDSCTFNVTLQVPVGGEPGGYVNTTSQLTGDVGGNPETGSPASEALYVQPAPRLTKEFTDDPVGPGGTATVEFTVTNTSSTNGAADIAFTDEFYVGLNTAAPSVQNDICGAGSIAILAPLVPDTTPAKLTVAGGDLAASDSCTFNIVLDVANDVPSGIYENTTSEITGTVEGMSYTGPPATDSLVIYGAPIFNKSFTDDPVIPGDTVTLEFNLTNHDSTRTATDIAFTDDLDSSLADLSAVGLPASDICGVGSEISGTTSLSFTGGNLGPTESCTFSVTLQTPAAADSGTYPNITSNVTATMDGISLIGVAASDDLMIGELTLAKSFTDDPVIPGGTANLQFTLTNLSADTGATDITFSDDLDAVIENLSGIGLPLNGICGGGDLIQEERDVDPDLPVVWHTFLKFSGGTLAAGDSCTFDVTLNIPAGVISGSYPNVTQEFTASLGDGPIAFQNANDNLVVNSDLLMISKSFTDDPIVPGGTGTLEFTITNLHGTQTVTGITFTDDLDALVTGLAATGLPADDVCGAGSQIDGAGLLTLTNGNLGPLGSCTFSVQYQVPGGASIGATVTNTTSVVTGFIGGLAVSGDAATDDLTINDMGFTKAFTTATTPGGTTGLTFTIENKDTTATVSDISFTDDLNDTLAGLAATNVPLNGICGADSGLTGVSTLSFARGRLGPGESCTFTVDLQVPTNAPAGAHLNTTGDLLVGGGKAADPASASLTVNSEPPPPTYTISGNVTNAATGAAIQGVTMSFSHDSGFAVTDQNGHYAYGVVQGTTTTVTPSKTGYLNWDPPSQSFSNIGADIIQDFQGTSETFTISGRVTDGVDPIEGVTLTFSHDGGTAAADADGNYTYTVDYGTTTTVTPSNPGYGNWTPPSATFNNVTEDKIQDFQGTLTTVTISGRATDGADPIEGVTLTFSHDNGTAVTDANGNYSHAVDYGVTTTITPSKTGYASWNPPNATFTDISADATQDFVGTRQTFTVSGRVTDGTDPVEGVVITFSHDNGTAVTDANGNYTYQVDSGVTTTLTPSKDGWGDWEPPGKTFENITENRTQDFVGAFNAFRVSGTVTADGVGLEGATITFTQGRGTTTTDSEGRYSFTVDGGMTTTITPSHPGVTQWTPGSITLENVTSDRPGQNFQGTLSIHGLTVGKSGNGDGLVTSDPAGIDCGTDCSESYPYGTTVLLTALADSGSVFGGWSGGGCGGTDPCEVLIDGAKSVNAAFDIEGESADLVLVKETNTFTPVAGGSVTFIIRITNKGPDDAAGIKVTDLLPTGLTYVNDSSAGAYDSVTGVWTVGALNKGKTADLAVNATFDTADIVTNTAEITDSDLPDPDETNNIASVTLDPQAVAADLAIDKTGSPNPAAVGENMVFTLTVGNNGPRTAEGVRVTDVIPSDLTDVEYQIQEENGGGYTPWPDNNTLSLEDLEPDAVWTVWVKGRIASLPENELLSNEAEVTSDIDDPVLGNNSSQIDIPVSQQVNVSDLAVVKSVDKQTAAVGENVVINITVTNNGPDDAEDVEVKDKLRTDLIHVSDDGNSTYDPGSGIWNVGNIGNGRTKTLNITAQIGLDGPIGNTARIERSKSRDNNTANNSSTININDDNPYPDLGLGSTLNPLDGSTIDEYLIANGDRFEFVVYFENNSVPDISGAQVGTTLPDGLAVVEATPSTGCYDMNDNIWHVDDPLACGGSSSGLSEEVRNGDGSVLTLAVEITNADLLNPGVIIATILEAENDPDQTNNTTSQVINRGDSFVVDLVVSVNVYPVEVDFYQSVLFTIRVRNTGPDTAGGIQIQNVLPGELTLIGSYPSAGAFSSGNGIWTVGNLAVSEPATLFLAATPNAAGENLEFTAGVSHVAETEINTGNDSDKVTFTINPPPSGGGGGGGGGGGCFLENLIEW